jgi:hypothetical protein
MEEQPFTYSHRPKPFSNELDLRLDGTSLFAERGRSHQTYPLKDIELIHLSYEPQNLARLAFSCYVQVRDGNSVRFNTVSWRSLVAIDRQDVDFRQFVLSLVRAVHAKNPDVRLEAGIGVLRYWLMLIMGCALVITLIVAVFYLASRPNQLQSGLNYVYAGLGVVTSGYLGFWLHQFLTRNRPRTFTPNEPPEGVLP